MAARIFVGTASWSDPEFVRDWYPAGLAPGARLAYYAQRFEMVEVNSTFYSIPSPGLVEKWARTTPSDFVFHLKLHKLLSRHACEPGLLPRDLQKNAKGNRIVLTPELESEVAARFLEGISPLEATGKLGVLLLQLSPDFSPRKNALTELDDLLGQLSTRQVVVELRNRNWLGDELADATVGYFRDRKITLVSVDAPQSTHFTVMPVVDLITNPAISYLRLHGRDERGYLSGRTVAERFNYNYSDHELDSIASRAAHLAAETEEVQVVFNNNCSDYAPNNAARLRELLGQVSRPAASSSLPEQEQFDL